MVPRPQVRSGPKRGRGPVNSPALGGRAAGSRPCEAAVGSQAGADAAAVPKASATGIVDAGGPSRVGRRLKTANEVAAAAVKRAGGEAPSAAALGGSSPGAVAAGRERGAQPRGCGALGHDRGSSVDFRQQTDHLQGGGSSDAGEGPATRAPKGACRPKEQQQLPQTDEELQYLRAAFEEDSETRAFLQHLKLHASRAAQGKLVWFWGKLGNCPVKVLVDSGANANFVSEGFVRQSGLHTRALPPHREYSVTLADRHTLKLERVVTDAQLQLPASTGPWRGACRGRAALRVLPGLDAYARRDSRHPVVGNIRGHPLPFPLRRCDSLS